MRDHLQVAPNTNLASLDLRSYSPEVFDFRLVDTYGRDEMPDAFMDVPPLLPLDKALVSIFDVHHLLTKFLTLLPSLTTPPCI